MSRYNNYGHFMIAVLEEADRKSNRKYMYGLVQLFHLEGKNEQIIKIIYAILNVGWPAFLAVCALLVLGPVAFIAALAAFVVGGIGAVIIAALAVYGGVKAIKLLYSNKTTPLKILEIGRAYKKEFDTHIHQCSYIDSLVDKASDELISGFEQ